MKMHLSKAIFNNRAPFDKITIDFEENSISVVTAVNGSGKTTLLSHLADAFHEMARPFYPEEFQNKKNQFYRISSSSFNLDQQKPSLVYLRFETEDDHIDFVDISKHCTEENYDSVINIDDKIPYSELSQQLTTTHNKC